MGRKRSAHPQWSPNRNQTPPSEDELRALIRKSPCARPGFQKRIARAGGPAPTTRWASCCGRELRKLFPKTDPSMPTIGFPLAACVPIQTLTQPLPPRRASACPRKSGWRDVVVRAGNVGWHGQYRGERSAGWGAADCSMRWVTLSRSTLRARHGSRVVYRRCSRTDDLDTASLAAIAARIAKKRCCRTRQSRAAQWAWPIAAEHEAVVSSAGRVPFELVTGSSVLFGSTAVALRAASSARRGVVDLSALWAGPPCSTPPLAGRCRCRESGKARTRPGCDCVRENKHVFHALLNQGKASVVSRFSRTRTTGKRCLSLIGTGGCRH